jgi:general stress protein YciG
VTKRKDKPAITVAEAGRQGGKKTLAKYGREHYAEIGKRGGTTTFERRGRQHCVDAGRLGGNKTSEKHGSSHYKKIGKRGGQRVAVVMKKFGGLIEKAKED